LEVLGFSFFVSDFISGIGLAIFGWYHCVVGSKR